MKLKRNSRKIRDTLKALTHMSALPYEGETLIDELVKISTLVSFPRGYRLYDIGEESDKLYIIVSGKVLSQDDRDNTKFYSNEGQTVGEIGLLQNTPRKLPAVCISECELIMIKRDDLTALIHKDTSNPGLLYYRWISLSLSDKVIAGRIPRKSNESNSPDELYQWLLPKMDLKSKAPAQVYKTVMAEAEKRLIEATLTLYNGNVFKAAKALGFSKVTLYRKMETLMIIKPRELAHDADILSMQSNTLRK